MLQRASDHAAVEVGGTRRLGRRILGTEKRPHLHSSGGLPDLDMDHGNAVAKRELDDVAGPAGPALDPLRLRRAREDAGKLVAHVASGGPARVLAVPDGDEDVGMGHDRSPDLDIGRFEVCAVAGQRDDFVGGGEGLLEAVELLAGGEVVAIFVRLEGKKSANEIAAGAGAEVPPGVSGTNAEALDGGGRDPRAVPP